MRKAVFYIGIAGIAIGLILVIGGTMEFARYNGLELRYRLRDTDLMIYGISIAVVSLLIAFIAKIFVNQRG